MMMSLSCARWCICGDEAALELRALLAGAQLAARVDLGPRGAVLGQRLDLGAVAGLGGLLPLANDLEIGDLFQARRASAPFPRRRFSGGRRSWRGPSCSRRAAAPRCCSRNGMSLKKSCSCRFLVPVEITTRLPDRIAGTRYASVLPVPVPASTIRCFFSASAASTASAMCKLARRDIRSSDATRKAGPYGQRTGGRRVFRAVLWWGRPRMIQFYRGWQGQAETPARPSSTGPEC